MGMASIDSQLEVTKYGSSIQQPRCLVVFVNVSYLMIFRLLSSKDHFMGLVPVQIRITEVTCKVVLIRALALEVHLFPVWE